MLLLTWVFIQPLFPPYKWLWCFEHSSVRFLIGFCFETSLEKQVRTATWNPNKQEFLHQETNPCKNNSYHYPSFTISSNYAKTWKRKWRYINTIRIKHHGHKNHWYHRQLSTPISKTSAIANCDRAHPLLQPSINTHSVKKAFSINLLKTKHYSVLSQTQTLTAALQTDRKTVSQWNIMKPSVLQSPANFINIQMAQPHPTPSPSVNLRRSICSNWQQEKETF